MKEESGQSAPESQSGMKVKEGILEPQHNDPSEVADLRKEGEVEEANLQDDKKPRDQQKDAPNKSGNYSSVKNAVAAILCIAAMVAGAATGFFIPGLIIAAFIAYFATKDGLENYNNNRQQSQPSIDDKDDLKGQVKELQKQLEAITNKQEQKSSANQGQNQDSQQQESGPNAKEQEQDSVQKTLEDLKARVEQLESENEAKGLKIEELKNDLEAVKEGGGEEINQREGGVGSTAAELINVAANLQKAGVSSAGEGNQGGGAEVGSGGQGSTQQAGGKGGAR